MALVPTASASGLVFENGFAVDCATPIPESFAEAIRKRQLSKGDVFYSARDAYSNPDWKASLTKLSYAIQIRESLTGGRIVLFELYTVSNKTLISSGRYKLDWDAFLKRLREANFSDLKNNSVTE